MGSSSAPWNSGDCSGLIGGVQVHSARRRATHGSNNWQPKLWLSLCHTGLGGSLPSCHHKPFSEKGLPLSAHACTLPSLLTVSIISKKDSCPLLCLDSRGIETLQNRAQPQHIRSAPLTAPVVELTEG